MKPEYCNFVKQSLPGCIVVWNSKVNVGDKWYLSNISLVKLLKNRWYLSREGLV